MIQKLYDKIEPEFIEASVASNRILLRISCIFTGIVELLNMMRVLVFSTAGLGTLNNRIYFGFYTVLFSCSVIFLIVDAMKINQRQKYHVCLITGSIFLLWHTLLNTYDIYSSHTATLTTMVTVLTIFATLFVMKPVYAVANFVVNYLLFVFLVPGPINSGIKINITITVLLCIVVYFVRARHTFIELSQKKELNKVSLELEEEKERFRLSNEQYEIICQSGKFIAFRWDVQKDEARFSKEWEEIFGRPVWIPSFSQFIKKEANLKPYQKEEICQLIDNVYQKVHYQNTELLLLLDSGEERWFELQVTTQLNKKGEPVYAIGIIFDIMPQKEKVFQLKQELQRDTFTGILNKTTIENYGRKQLYELHQNERLVMLIVDLDEFKRVNDTYGHPIGDYVLKEVAGLIRRRIPKSANVGRIGGDEFLILATVADSTGVSLMRNYAQRIVQEIPYIQWEGESISITCSIGMAVAEYGEVNYLELYNAADRALYHAKRTGKNKLVQYEKIMEAE